MKIYEPHPGMYEYKYIPAFARFLLDHHLDAYVQDQLKLAREVDVPVLKFLKGYSEEQLFSFLKQSSQEYLMYLANNKAKEQLSTSLNRWLANDLKIIGKEQLSSKDVTIINYLRQKLFKKWIRSYPVSMEERYDLNDEIDNFFFGAVTSGTDTLVEILKETIASESHFNAQMINTSPAIIFIFDLIEGKEVYINGNVQPIMGYTPHEILEMGNNLLTVLTHPDDIATLVNGISQISQENTNETRHLEYRFRHKDGKYRWLRTYHSIFRRNAEGKAIEILGTTFEVTKEKETALALKKREAQLLEAQSIAHLGSFEWDMVNDVSVNTPELDNIFDLAGSNGGMTRFLSRVHPDDRQTVEDAIGQSFTSGQYDCQYRYLGNNGEKVLWAHGLVTFDNGRAVKMTGTVQDITQLKKIEEELINKTRELERSNESLQQFASVASHDLKEPLRKMSMYSDMVLFNEEEKLSEQSKVNLGKVKSSAIRMQQMIEDILNFSSIKTDSGKKLVKLTDVIQQTLVILEETIRDKRADITYSNLPEIKVSASQMRQLFQNLIVNGLKFAKAGSTPRINITHRYADKNEFQSPALKPADRYLVIRVQDNGIGFRQEHADKIFALFTRLHPQSTYEGSGLGLSICKRIAENHGGIIFAEGEVDKGAAFSIVLPDIA